MSLPFTQKMLINWAGPQVFRDAQILVEKNMVQDVELQPPMIQGSVLWCNRPLKTALRMMPDGTAENYCPCRDSRERGIICAHAIALCIELIRRTHHPERIAARQEEVRRAARLARVNEGEYLRRVKPDTPGAVPARLQVTLGRDWRAAGRETGRIPLLCAVECRGRMLPLDEVPRDLPLAFRQAEESFLFVLEDIAEGPAPSRLQVGAVDFINLLELNAGLPFAQEETGVPITVHAARLTSFLRLSLDRETGELVLSIHTELPFAAPGEAPLYLFSARSGWVLGAENFWPLEQVLPDPLRSVYHQPTRVPRASVPHFMLTELPTLARFMRLETDIAMDLFAIEPVTPRFRLVVRGSPASLATTLYAEYGELSLVAGRPDPAGHFAIPDPADILRYTVRNPAAETQALQQLRQFGFDGEAGNALTPIVGCREVLNFLGSHLPAIRRAGWKVELEGTVEPFMESMRGATPVVNIATGGGGWFEVGFHFEDTDGCNLTPADVQRALRKGDSFLERDGHTILLDGDAIRSMLDVFEDCASQEGGAPGCFRMPNIYASYVQSSLDALDGVDIEAGPDWRTVAQDQARRAVAAEPLALAPPLDTTLRAYQKEGVQWIRHLEANLFCGILADEMGLGKTLQALVWIELERSHAEARHKPALIVCPTSLVENWAEEAHRFVPRLRVLTISGADRHAKWGEIERSDLVITSYALLRRDLENYLQREFSITVLDEAQHIKNHSTQNAIAAKQLKATHRLVLTGTPIENSVADLWSIMDFLMPGYLGAYEAFRRRYELPVAQGGPEGDAAQLKLRRKLYPFLLRRLKSEVARDLPPRIERLATCTLSADQKTVYKELLESSRRRLSDMVSKQGFQRSRMEVFKTLLRLRQVCCHLDLLRLPGLRSEVPSAKMDLFFELLDEALDGGHRVLVFSQFVAMLAILRRELEQRRLAYCYLDGSSVERQSIVREFNTNRAIPLFLISLKAGGTGLNLTGADMVIHFDPWWNPAVEDQATDRAHRIGQKKTVYSVKLITRGTVEEKVLALQKRKKIVIDATLAREQGALPRFTWEDVQDLLDATGD